MTLTTDFRQVTDRIIICRHDLIRRENLALVARLTLTIAEIDLDTARRALMARADAGGNDTARRAYAERETTDEREAVIDARRDLTLAEQDVNMANAAAAAIEAMYTTYADGSPVAESAIDLYRDYLAANANQPPADVRALLAWQRGPEQDDLFGDDEHAERQTAAQAALASAQGQMN